MILRFVKGGYGFGNLGIRLKFALLIHQNAGVAQLVEHDLAKVGVASSSLVSRSLKKSITTKVMEIQKCETNSHFCFLRKSLSGGNRLGLVV